MFLTMPVITSEIWVWEKNFSFFFGDITFEMELGQWTCCAGAQMTGGACLQAGSHQMVVEAMGKAEIFKENVKDSIKPPGKFCHLRGKIGGEKYSRNLRRSSNKVRRRSMGYSVMKTM